VLESFDRSKMSNVSTVLCITSRLKSHLILGYLVHDVCPYMLGVLSTDDVLYGLTCGKCDTLLLSSANPRILCTSKNIILTCSKVLGCLGGPAPANEDFFARGTFLSGSHRNGADVLPRNFHCVTKRSHTRTSFRFRVLHSVDFTQNFAGALARRALSG